MALSVAGGQQSDPAEHGVSAVPSLGLGGGTPSPVVGSLQGEFSRKSDQDMQSRTWYSFFHSSTALSKIFGEKASLEDLVETFEGANAAADARERRRTAAIMVRNDDVVNGCSKVSDERS